MHRCSKMARLITVMLILGVLLSGCGEQEVFVQEFFGNLSSLQFDKTNEMAVYPSGEAVTFNYTDAQKQEIADIYYSRMTFEIVPLEAGEGQNAAPNEDTVGVEVTRLDERILLKSFLDQITQEGLRGGLFGGMQKALAHSYQTLLSHLKSDNAPFITQRIVVTVREMEGQYYICKDTALESVTSRPLAGIYSVLEPLQRPLQ